MAYEVELFGLTGVPVGNPVGWSGTGVVTGSLGAVGGAKVVMLVGSGVEGLVELVLSVSFFRSMISIRPVFPSMQNSISLLVGVGRGIGERNGENEGPRENGEPRLR